MTQRLVKQLIKEGYQYIVKTGDHTFATTKASMPFKDSDDFACWEIYKNESIKDLKKEVYYKLEDLIDKN